MKHPTVLKTPHRRECFESKFVLDAVGISSEAVYHDGWWRLIVDAGDQQRAASELEAYRRENAELSGARSTITPIYDGAAVSVFGYATTIMLVAILTARSTFGLDWLAAGRMHAGSVCDGQVWRIVTALTLHLDAGHISSNLLFGTIFGFMASRVLGGGVAWLGIVVAGALGNGINALVQPSTHTSIGASTAVFAALGTIVSHALRRQPGVPEKPLRRWSPLIGGAVLLGLTGIGGERTDVAAHFAGFLAGLLIGSIACRLPHRWLKSTTVQKSTGSIAIAVVIIAWLIALSTAE